MPMAKGVGGEGSDGLDGNKLFGGLNTFLVSAAPSILPLSYASEINGSVVLAKWRCRKRSGHKYQFSQSAGGAY